MEATLQTKSLVVWMVTDGKPGHRNQLLGLQQCLEFLNSAVDVHWCAASEFRMSSLDWLVKRNPQPALPHPDWVVGAGHQTHVVLLYVKWVLKSKAIVLMQPSLPCSWFDACVIPRHDAPKSADNTLKTFGVLNTMRPNPDQRLPNQGVILIGGENRHFQWDTQSIVEQVARICEAQPTINWLLTNSRRTPDDFVISLGQCSILNLTIVAHDQTPPGWVKAQLESSAQVWVTCDSVSMVYESLTAGAPTGLLQMAPLRQSRVVKGMGEVVAESYANGFARWDLKRRLPAPIKPLWEAQRVAHWLLSRFAGPPLEGAKL